MNEKRTNWFKRLAKGLSKTHQNFIKKVEGILKYRTRLDPDLIDELEETLILSDCGVQTTGLIIERLKGQYDGKKETPAYDVLRDIILDILKKAQGPFCIDSHKPFIMMVLGVNGVGKTTTIAKIAYKLREQGKNVLLVAGDTFRAAAIEQLQIWADRSGVTLIKHKIGADPSAVVYDGIQAAKSRGVDCVIVDTAGRLHTKKNLMTELQKMKKILGREVPGSPHEIILVLDATTGQNALQQAKEFDQKIGLTGIALTKLDGTARGGIIIGIANELDIPVKFIGVGEGLEDLRDFDPDLFVQALFEESEDVSGG